MLSNAPLKKKHSSDRTGSSNSGSIPGCTSTPQYVCMACLSLEDKLYGVDSSGSGYGPPVAGSCGQSNETSGSIKNGAFFDQPSERPSASDEMLYSVKIIFTATTVKKFLMIDTSGRHS